MNDPSPIRYASDQADYLRQLVKQRQQIANAPEDPPRLVAVLGGQRGAGTTSLAVNLAVALSQFGRRVMLVDANLETADVARMCGVDEAAGVHEVLARRASVRETIQRGPAGVIVVPGKGTLGESECSYGPQQELIEQLRGLGNLADTVLLDVGAGLSSPVRRFVEAADALLVVSAGDNQAIMDSYAAIKLLLPPRRELWVGSLINKVVNPQAAAELQERLIVCCRRFLGRSVEPMGAIPTDPEVPRSGDAGRPYVVAAPGCAATRAVQRLAAVVAAAAEPPQPASEPQRQAA